MKKLLPIFLLLQFVYLFAAAQYKLTGAVKDQSGEPVPFSSVYIKNTTKGSSANADGLFSINIDKGNYTLVFKAIGYKSLEKNISVTGNLEVNATLSEEAFTLQDVVIRPGAEDPAFEMIRKTIKKRKAHLNEVEEFSVDVYIKGLQKLLNAPKKFLGQDIEKITREMGLDSTRRGIIYLSESESRYSFKQPDNVHEEMISSKVSGSNRAFSYNRASDLKVDFYENYQNWDGISLRPLVSPIADNALFYYNYKYLGVSTENGHTIFKIRVIPKRSKDPVYRGVIYIIEDEWRLYDVDLYLTKEANINFVDTIQIRQQFIPLENNVWMPSSVKFDFKGGLFGFKLGGYFIAVFKNYDITTKKSKKTFAEVMRITKEVNKKDSAYWEQARPIPLTPEEVTDYRKKETLAKKRESKEYLDSLDKENNKFKILGFIIGNGYSIRNRYKKESYNFSALKDAVYFNTVEGLGINYQASYRKVIDSLSNKMLILTAKGRYGFSSKKFYPAVSASFPVGQYKLGLAVGGDVLNLNNQDNQTLLGNTFGSLYYEQNRLKLYEKKYAFASLSGPVAGGLTGGIYTEFANRNALQNTTDYKWRDVKDRVYTSNNPLDPSNDAPFFQENQSFKIGVMLSYNFSNKYVTYPYGKFYVSSKYPRLTVGYVKGINNVFGSDVDYDQVYGEITKTDIPLGFYGKFSFMVGAGKFLNNNKIEFVDFKHFSGNEGVLFNSGINGFLFLQYYKYSTPEKYLEAHVEHNFSGFILNKVPLIRKMKLEEIVGANYLTNPGVGNYAEAYFGVRYLGFKAYYGFSFIGGKEVDNGFKISIGL